MGRTVGIDCIRTQRNSRFWLAARGPLARLSHWDGPSTALPAASAPKRRSPSSSRARLRAGARVFNAAAGSLGASAARVHSYRGISRRIRSSRALMPWDAFAHTADCPNPDRGTLLPMPADSTGPYRGMSRRIPSQSRSTNVGCPRPHRPTCARIRRNRRPLPPMSKGRRRGTKARPEGWARASPGIAHECSRMDHAIPMHAHSHVTEFFKAAHRAEAPTRRRRRRTNPV